MPSSAHPLTHAPDADYLARLQRYWKVHRVFPAMTKLAAVVGLNSPAGVFAVVGRLTDAGYLQRLDGRIAPTPAFFGRRLLGPVRAGLPQPASQEPVELVTIDDYLIDEPGRTSLFRVKGDSMKDAGILEGDLVAVEHHTPTRAGDIVVACVDDELTVKVLCEDSQGFFLRARNPAYLDIRPGRSLEVLGVVVGVVRRLR